MWLCLQVLFVLIFLLIAGEIMRLHEKLDARAYLFKGEMLFKTHDSHD